MNGWSMLALGAGCLCGGFSRVGVSWAMHRWMGPDLPYGTLAVNLSGCLLVGFFSTVGQGRIPISVEARLLLMTGFCGAYTTFSALILEISALLQHGTWVKALSYILLSVLAGLVLLRIGAALGELI